MMEAHRLDGAIDLSSPLERKLMDTSLADVLDMVASMINMGVRNGYTSDERLDVVDEQADKITVGVFDDIVDTFDTGDVGGCLDVYVALGLVVANLLRNFAKSTMMAIDLTEIEMEFGLIEDEAGGE